MPQQIGILIAFVLPAAIAATAYDAGQQPIAVAQQSAPGNSHHEADQTDETRNCKSAAARVDELFQAVRTSDVERIAAVLSDTGVNTRDCQGRTPLYVAISERQIAAAELLLQKHANPNLRVTGGDAPLINAVRSDEPELVHLLVAFGADVNIRTDQGYVLLEAVREGSPAIVADLLNRGANARVRNEQGRTAIMFAIERGYPEMVRSLLAAGADVNARSDEGGDHAVELAFRENRSDLLRLLLAAGADANVTTITGTVLTDAIAAGKIGIVKLLLDHNASVSTPNAEGDGPISIARTKGYTEIENLLRAAGARE
jgi:ankyrin repeat protein